MRLELSCIEYVRTPDTDPDLSYLTQDYSDCRPEDAAKYREQDAERLADYGTSWWCIGISARATITFREDQSVWSVNQTIVSGGLWGIETDIGDGYFDQVAADEASDLKSMLLAMGLSEETIDAAISAAKWLN